MLIAIIGMGIFAANFIPGWADAWSSHRVPSRSVGEDIGLGFGIAFAGALISAFGNVVRGFEQRRRR